MGSIDSGLSRLFVALMLIGTSQAASGASSGAQFGQGESESLVDLYHKLNSELSENALDDIIASDDRNLMGTWRVSHVDVNPAASRCLTRLKVPADYPSRIVSDPVLTAAYSRQVRAGCLRLAASSSFDDRARESFVCSISRARDGVPESTSKAIVGLAGTITRSRLLLPDKVTQFDNTREVETPVTGVDGDIEFLCGINVDLLNQNPRPVAQNEAWRIEKLAGIKARLAQLGAIEQQAKTGEAEDTRHLRIEIARLKTVAASLDHLVGRYNACLSSYRFFDRLHHEDLMKYASFENGAANFETRDGRKSGYPDPQCPEVASRLKASVASAEAHADGRSARYVSTYDMRRGLSEQGSHEHRICERQIQVCERPSLMGKAFEGVLQTTRKLLDQRP